MTSGQLRRACPNLQFGAQLSSVGQSKQCSSARRASQLGREQSPLELTASSLLDSPPPLLLLLQNTSRG